MVEDDEALVASMAYFQSLRREWHKRNGSGHLECPIPAWNDIRTIDQQIFVRSMKIAIAATKPDNMRRVMESLGRAF